MAVHAQSMHARDIETKHKRGEEKKHNAKGGKKQKQRNFYAEYHFRRLKGNEHELLFHWRQTNNCSSIPDLQQNSSFHSSKLTLSSLNVTTPCMR